MTKTIPSYLRIHREDDASQEQADLSLLGSIEEFWKTYSDATGWQLDRSGDEADGVDLVPASFNADGAAESRELVGKIVATRLAESALGLTEQLDAAEKTIRNQEAELAARAIVLETDAERSQLADRIEATLADAAAATGCDAAAFYLLDDDTQYLMARSVHGLPKDRLGQRRLLQGSRGDLESLVQGVVAIDDADDSPLDAWNLPETFASGICVAIECDGLPIGTLWVFRKAIAKFGVAETAAARLAASRLSLELARVANQPAAVALADDTPLRDVADWQFESLPIGSALAQDWRVDGMIESHRSWATGWHTWDVLPDGTLMFAIAEAVDQTARGAMHASIARAALVAHTGYRHTPAQLLQRISDTLWQSSTGEQLVSLLYARIDPETGEGEVASAGSIAAMIGSRRGYRPLVDGQSDPLNTNIDAAGSAETFRLDVGETLLAYTSGMVEDGATQTMLGDRLRAAMEAGDNNPLALIRRSMAGSPVAHERGAATLVRTPRHES